MLVGHLIILISTTTLGFPVTNPKIPSVKVLEFLKNFGYIEGDDDTFGALYTENGISETIKNVQKFGDLPQTGVLDNATLALMATPRCGNADIIRNKRSKRYVLGSEGWGKRTISYFIANWSPKLGQASVSRNIELALKTWGKYGHLKFEKRQNPDADIIVAFGSGYHGDTSPFDGPGNILAHAFFPNEGSDGFGGDIHFDADENWVDGNGTDGTEFVMVALHELGHSLGLAHSPVSGSVMFPYYRGLDGNEKELQLGYDDILGMYELYIRRNIAEEAPTSVSPTSTSVETSTGVSPTISTSVETSTGVSPTISTSVETSTFGVSSVETSTPVVVYHGDDESVETHKNHDDTHGIPSTNSPSLPNICDASFDAVAVLRDQIFIFKEQYLWRLDDLSRIVPGYPISISQMFPDLPKSVKKVDAAYERPDGMIVLFSGDKFWVYDGKKFIEGSPRPLSDYGLPDTLDKIDAVQTWARNGKTYFYKDEIFWRYNETEGRMDEGYPKHMKRWRGVPHHLDAATTFRGITYFFKDKLYWNVG
ncbi:Matrix metalloproteinase-16-like Protein [Tribolium castaneum]|uniref:Matrix metalloproteinase-16-like Protein n=1 Tax=Tribolium castaneum TaxID=7070 RepID=D6X192_TRICA|nr:Matrix metalloproteinase-16-like Protein [Tribolium castaneum]